MAKSLIIAEKPSVAKDIAKVLGNFTDQKEYLENDLYVVSWAVGHLVEFIDPEEIDPKYKAWKLEDLPILPKTFQLKAKSNCKDRLKILDNLLKRKDIESIINACDAGREGELIFREILEYCKCTKPTKRLWLQSMTPDAIRQAFAIMCPGEEKDSLGDAAKCRSEADWLIGINATRALTKRLRTRSEKSSWSAGRVQTPTLAMVAERELSILSFRPTPFWVLKGTFRAPEGSDEFHIYEGTWYDPKFKQIPDDPRKNDWITTPEKLKEIEEAVKGQLGEVKESRKNRLSQAGNPFDLTTLQREANKRFGMSARSTLAIAQRLYESYKLITYPRTSSQCLPSDYQKPVNDVLNVLMSYRGKQAESRLDYPTYVRSADYLKNQGLQNASRIFNDSKISDHFAIIPTTTRIPAKLKEEEIKIYDLIVRRFLAAFYPPAQYIDIERTTVVNDQHFRSKGSLLVAPGWKEVYGRDSNDEDSQRLPELKPISGKTSVGARNLNLEEKSEQTKPIARLSEATLLSAMEKAGNQIDDKEIQKELKDTGGLGTPATRAEIIESLLTRGYIERIDRSLRATPKGIMLIDMLERIDIARLTSPSLTGEMEKHLGEVEQGQRQRKSYMEEIVDYTIDIITKTKDFDYDALFAHDKPIGKCPCCHEGMVYERMRFYSCEHNTGKENAKCNFIIWKDRSGRYIDKLTATELVNEGQSGLLEGFSTSNNKSYHTILRLNPLTHEVEFAGENPSSAYNVGNNFSEMPINAEPIHACPYHPDCKVIETETHYRCQQKCVEAKAHKSGFILPRTVCQRNISRQELIPYLENGKSDLLENFISKFNKPFKGYLVLKATGRHGFEFLPRASKKVAEGNMESETATKTARTRKTAKDGEGENATKTARTRKTAKDGEGETATKTARTRKTAKDGEGETATKTARTRKTAKDGEGETATKTARTRKTAKNGEGETATKTARTRKTAKAGESETATKTARTRKTAKAGEGENANIYAIDEDYDDSLPFDL